MFDSKTTPTIMKLFCVVVDFKQEKGKPILTDPEFENMKNELRKRFKKAVTFKKGDISTEPYKEVSVDGDKDHSCKGQSF